MTYPGSPIQRGARGDLVREIQIALTEQSLEIGAAGVDGVFGPQTEEAVVRFQQRNGLVVDGIVGPETWRALFAPSESPPSAWQPSEPRAPREAVARSQLKGLGAIALVGFTVWMLTR